MARVAELDEVMRSERQTDSCDPLPDASGVICVAEVHSMALSSATRIGGGTRSSHGDVASTGAGLAGAGNRNGFGAGVE
jgi:hypothetical protein